MKSLTIKLTVVLSLLLTAVACVSEDPKDISSSSTSTTYSSHKLEYVINIKTSKPIHLYHNATAMLAGIYKDGKLVGTSTFDSKDSPDVVKNTYQTRFYSKSMYFMYDYTIRTPKDESLVAPKLDNIEDYEQYLAEYEKYQKALDEKVEVIVILTLIDNGKKVGTFKKRHLLDRSEGSDSGDMQTLPIDYLEKALK